MATYQYAVTLITTLKDTTEYKETSTVTVGATNDVDADSLAVRVIQQELNKQMKHDNVADMKHADLRLTHKDGIKGIGYFNWVDTVCIGCTEKKHIDVVTFSALYEDDTDEYQCDYCGEVFPQIPYTREEQEHDRQRIKQRWEEVYSRV